MKATGKKTIDERFDEVAQAFAEQRDYTTFCFEKVQREVKQIESRLTRRLDRHELLLGEILGEVKALRSDDNRR